MHNPFMRVSQSLRPEKTCPAYLELVNMGRFGQRLSNICQDEIGACEVFALGEDKDLEVNDIESAMSFLFLHHLSRTSLIRHTLFLHRLILYKLNSHRSCLFQAFL
jgi:hypothetical protein